MKKIIVVILIIIVILLGVLIFILNNQENQDDVKNSNYEENEHLTINNVTRIKCIKYENEKEELYNIINQEKISKIKEIIENQELIEINSKNDEKDYIEITLFDNEEETQFVVYKGNIMRVKDKNYQVNTNAYNDLTDTLEPVYYLHDSDIKIPDEKNCTNMQEKVLNGLNENEVEQINKKLREAHITLEFLLMNGTKNLKQSDSIYWNLYNNAETITEPTGEELDFTANSCFQAIANNIAEIADVLLDKETKEIFKETYERLEKAMEYKDLGEIFKIHEVIHDFDYWIINYPAHYDTAPAPDWEGIETYFGTTI